MKFSKVIGKIDKSLLKAAEEYLTKVFLELGLKSGHGSPEQLKGGDPLLASLLYPVEHVATLNIPTAATDGRRFYWNPKFILGKPKLGLRLICGHEAWHAIYMHPQRRAGRNPKLWNIAVDYIVNGIVMDDIKSRGLSAPDIFKNNLGNYLTIEQYAEMLKNPFANSENLEDMEEVDNQSNIKLPKIDDDRELTEQEKKELEKKSKPAKFFFADPNMPADMKKPEKIYDYLYKLLPKCPKCGRLGIYQLPKEMQDKKKKKSEQGETTQEQPQPSDKNQGNDHQDHQHGDGEPCDHKEDSPGESSSQKGSCDHDSNDSSDSGDCGHGCDTCGGGYDIFGLGGTVDDHMDAEESPEKMAKRLADAIRSAKAMGAGSIPASLEEELGELMAPKIRWQDFIRTRLRKARDGNAKNDWTRFKARPLFAGLLVPKKINHVANFCCLLDTSGSMSNQDMAYGISQLQSLDERSEGWIVPADAAIYWDKATKLRKANAEELSKVKVIGRGGTVFGSFTSDYKEHCGQCDFLILITDGYLIDTDLADMVDPGIPIYWLITSSLDSFVPPFGKVFHLDSTNSS